MPEGGGGRELIELICVGWVVESKTGSKYGDVCASIGVSRGDIVRTTETALLTRRQRSTQCAVPASDSLFMIRVTIDRVAHQWIERWGTDGLTYFPLQKDTHRADDGRSSSSSPLSSTSMGIAPFSWPLIPSTAAVSARSSSSRDGRLPLLL